MVDARVAGEVPGQGRGREVLDCKVLQRRRVQAEAPQVGREDQGPVGLHKAKRGADQRDMVALDIEARVHAL